MVFNFCGTFGAQLSATLLLFFGKIAYILPIILLSILCKIISLKEKFKKNLVYMIYAIIHSFLFIVFSCCLIELHSFFVLNNNFLGGIIGIMISDIFQKLLKNIYCVILLTIFLWIYSCILFIFCFFKK